MLRSLWRRLRPRRRVVLDPRPRRGVEELEAGLFRGLDDDPQVDLLPADGGRLPEGLCRLELAIEGRGCELAPLLFCDRGRGFEAAGRTPLPPSSARLLVDIPEGCRSLRLDPLEAPGTFRVGPIVAEELPAMPRLVFFEDRVPYEKLGAGYPRARRMIRALTALGWRVAFYSLRAREDWGPALAELGDEVEPLLCWGQPRLADFFEARAGVYEAMLVSRPHNMALLAPFVERAPGRLIYDAEAIYADRVIARRALMGDPLPAAERAALIDDELSLAGAADRVLCVSSAEAARFVASGARVEVVSHACEAAPGPAGFAERAGFLFVGALRDEGSPNVEGLRWFLADAWPVIHAETGARLVIAGGGGERFSSVAGVEAPGFVEDLEPLYGAARVFLAPTRFAAGIPLKLIEAAARGLPAAATRLLAGQLGWSEEVVAAEPAELGGACLRLYRDADLWRRCRAAGLERVARDHGPEEVFKAALERALGAES